MHSHNLAAAPRAGCLISGSGPMAEARPFLNTRAAAAYLCIGWRKLRKLRVSGQGPRFRKHGRLILYCVEDLDAWSRATIVEGRGDA